MKANSLEELVIDSNIAGELRNYTDWHTRLVKFAQLVADWQKEQIFKDAVEASVNTYELIPGGSAYVEFVADMPVARFRSNDKVRIVVLKEEE